jgi:hypothetical protein
VASGRDVPHDQCDQERALSRTRERHRERTRFGRESSRRLAKSWGRPLARACPSVCFSSVTGLQPRGGLSSSWSMRQHAAVSNEGFAAVETAGFAAVLERGLRRCLERGLRRCFERGLRPRASSPKRGGVALRGSSLWAAARPIRGRPPNPQPLRRLTPAPRPLTPSRKNHVQARVVHPPTLCGTVVGARGVPCWP